MKTTIASIFILCLSIIPNIIFAQNNLTPKFTSEHSSFDKKTEIYLHSGNVQTEISHFLIVNDSVKYNAFDEVIIFYASKANPIKIIDLNDEFVKPIFLDSDYKLDLLINPNILPQKDEQDIRIPTYPISESDSSTFESNKQYISHYGNVSITFEDLIIKSSKVKQNITTNELIIYGSKEDPITIQIVNPLNILSSNSTSIVNKLSKKGEFKINKNCVFNVLDNRLDLIQ
ncbi:hypothetical protein [Flammeovirga sp. SJP92]|uniref:hypothetical protein n=1 Tax=Flammeovirga sp. SJP92 TaxID=1775430 RepID=UPI0007870EFD|nr:hypothetical protein [Flammeovirga sp. SJP92]KXX67493.1 hypothetical protein AVL50_25845 [Flammeovirga sp. SJP92]